MEAMRESWTGERLDHLNQRVDEGFRQVDERFRQVDERFGRLEARFEKVDDRLYAIQRMLAQYSIGLTVTMALGFLSVLATTL
jgi:hypothetical protein